MATSCSTSTVGLRYLNVAASYVAPFNLLLDSHQRLQLQGTLNTEVGGAVPFGGNLGGIRC